MSQVVQTEFPDFELVHSLSVFVLDGNADDQADKMHCLKKIGKACTHACTPPRAHERMHAHKHTHAHTHTHAHIPHATHVRTYAPVHACTHGTRCCTHTRIMHACITCTHTPPRNSCVHFCTCSARMPMQAHIQRHTHATCICMQQCTHTQNTHASPTHCTLELGRHGDWMPRSSLKNSTEYAPSLSIFDVWRASPPRAHGRLLCNGSVIPGEITTQ